jgi:hypothetical protein
MQGLLITQSPILIPAWSLNKIFIFFWPSKQVLPVILTHFLTDKTAQVVYIYIFTVMLQTSSYSLDRKRSYVQKIKMEFKNILSKIDGLDKN